MTSHTRITVETVDGNMSAFEAVPSGRAKGAIVVFQEAFGQTGHIADVTDRFALHGWRAIAPDYYHRLGGPIFDYEEIASIQPVASSISVSSVEVDTSAALEYLAHIGFDPENVGLVGFCLGGTVNLFAATAHRVGAAVSFYGGGISESRTGLPPLKNIAARIQTPWLGLFGDLDQSIPAADIESLRQELAKSSIPSQIVCFPDADHGFHCDERPLVFNQTAADAAWRSALEWFEKFITFS
jgi:carboxymethylenebutenolidase